MKVFYLIVIMLITDNLFAQDLIQFRWSKRILLVCGDTTSDSYTSQIAYFSPATVKQELIDRKLIVLTNHTSCLNANEFSIKLYGLDGGLKLSSDKPVTTLEVFDLIDSMPMRKAEIRRKKG